MVIKQTIGTVNVRGTNNSGQAICVNCSKNVTVQGSITAWDTVKHWATSHKCEEK